MLTRLFEAEKGKEAHPEIEILKVLDRGICHYRWGRLDRPSSDIRLRSQPFWGSSMESLSKGAISKGRIQLGGGT